MDVKEPGTKAGVMKEIQSVMNCQLLLLLVLIVSQAACHRKKRFLIFPRQAPTRYQFVTGFGIPLQLEKESVTTGYVFKGQYYLPYNVTQLIPDFVGSSPWTNASLAAGGPQLVKREVRKESFEAGLSRKDFYQMLINLLETKGVDYGRACLLRTICESASKNFGYHSGVLGEMLHVLVSPSSSLDGRNLDEDFINAEISGKMGDNCEELFEDCRFSLINLISQIDF